MGGSIGKRHSDEQRLHFEDLGGAQIRTTVTRVTDHGLTVEQALPFLRLHGRVHDEAMRAAHIQSVSMVVYDGMPRLVLDLAYDEQGASDAAQAPARSAAASGVADAWPMRASHAGVARPRRRDETLSYDTPRPESVAPAAGDSAALALTVPGEIPRDDSTKLFRTLPPSQMTLEEQMLRSGQLTFRMHRYWEQELQPFLEGTGIRLRLWTRRADVVLRPWLIRVGLITVRGVRLGQQLAIAAVARGREAVQARRARSAKPVEAPDGTLDVTGRAEDWKDETGEAAA